jgi:hypothetical protein
LVRFLVGFGAGGLYCVDLPLRELKGEPLKYQQQCIRGSVQMIEMSIIIGVTMFVSRKRGVLNYELAIFTRLDFLSMKRPPRRKGPDYRFLYRYDSDNFRFYKFAVGPRNTKG